MNKTAVAAVSLILVSSFLFSGCRKDPELTSEQKRWISQMEKWYPDDEFTYTHHGTEFMGAYNESCIILESKNFPDFTFEFYEVNGELCSYYPTEYHREAIEEYYTGTLDGYFDFKDIEVEYKDHNYKARPCEYMSDEEFIEKHTTNELDVYLIYRKDNDFPSQDEIVSDILKYADSLGGNCELDFYLCGSGKNHKSELSYQIGCQNGTVKYLLVIEGDPKKEHDSTDIIRNIDLDEVRLIPEE